MCLLQQYSLRNEDGEGLHFYKPLDLSRDFLTCSETSHWAFLTQLPNSAVSYAWPREDMKPRTETSQACSSGLLMDWMWTASLIPKSYYETLMRGQILQTNLPAEEGKCLNSHYRWTITLTVCAYCSYCFWWCNQTENNINNTNWNKPSI